MNNYFHRKIQVSFWESIKPDLPQLTWFASITGMSDFSANLQQL